MSSFNISRAIVTMGIASLLGVACTPDPDPGLQVLNAWARATPPGAQVGAVYLTIHNAGAADRLVKVMTEASEKTEIHQTLMEDGRMKMRPVELLELPQGAEVVLQPGEMHLMLMGLKQALHEGEAVPLTLTFERAGPMQIQARVAALGAPKAPDANDSAHAGDH